MDLATLFQKIRTCIEHAKNREYIEALRLVMEIAIALGLAMGPQPMFSASSKKAMQASFGDAEAKSFDEVVQDLEDVYHQYNPKTTGSAATAAIPVKGPIIDVLLPLLKALWLKIWEQIWGF